ncbi:MAG: chalcone isomerase family protein [Gammaproteobacteria bacterium]|nr:chalcone isomerase family protein [Gammaproteobacteria bacterium]
MIRVILKAVLLTSLLQSVAGAARVGEIEVPEQVTIDGFDAPLQLNGAGIRKKFFISVYVGALYLPQPQRGVGQLLQSPPANRVLMHFVYSTVAKRKVDATWREGFVLNLDEATRAALAPRLERFVDLFTDLREGDRVWLDFVPGRGTRVSINGQARGLVEGDDFNAALLSIWLGREPVSDTLKNAMLGVDTH